jgi:hypothetical protein
VHRGSELYSDGKYGEWELTMNADVDDRDAVEGTVTLVERFRTPQRERYTCESGRVRFSAQR